LIWTLEVDDLLKANQRLLKKLYQSVFSGLKKTFTLDDAKQMIVEKSGLGLTEKQVTLAFSYSKLIVIDEIEDAAKMDKLNFTEFLEFIARIA